MKLVIDVHGLNKFFGNKHVVQDASLAVEEGHITGFLGPNGSGKTTTLRMLCGLLTPSSGSGTVLGMDFIRESGAIKRRTGYMTQKFSLYEDMTIEENLTFMARVHGLKHRQDKVKAALKRLALYDRRTQLAGDLSGGWKQRLALAASTLHEPKLLLLDEPTAGVDPKARREFWDEIHALSANGLTVLVSTHYMDEAERCHDIGYILNGALIARGTQEEIIQASGLYNLSAEGRFEQSTLNLIAESPQILRASAFGATVRVSSTNLAALKSATAHINYDAAGNPVTWHTTAPTLEDVFIQLMSGTKDSRYAA
ncbi:ABC transporter ATP-binding protein [Desulfovibrio sp. OttesenSCG-928-F07]|nr:ABC transporter ATP-binding protein [Desulfovibrio sp. OttesenSCG-928-F07]